MFGVIFPIILPTPGRMQDFQFRKCGKLNSHALDPFSPIISVDKYKNNLTLLESPLDITHSIIAILQKEIPNYGDYIDNPIIISRELDKKQVSSTKRAQIFKALYTILSRSAGTRRDIYAQHNKMNMNKIAQMTIHDMYEKYYAGMGPSWFIGYTTAEKQIISRAKNNLSPVSELYKNLLYQYSRYL